MTISNVTIQITPESSPSTPSWMGEVAAFAHVLTHEDLLKTIQEQVRLARARFGQYEVIDMVAVLARSCSEMVARTLRKLSCHRSQANTPSLHLHRRFVHRINHQPPFRSPVISPLPANKPRSGAYPVCAI
jgi:hypothetical protein